jgi:hypothetical protein
MSFSFFCCCWKLSLHISNFPQTLHLPLKCYLLLRHLQLIEKTMEMVGNGIRQLMICYTEKGCTWTLSLHPTHKLRRFASHIKLWAQFLRWHELGVVTPCSTWEGEGGDSVVQSLQPHSQFKCETSLGLSPKQTTEQNHISVPYKQEGPCGRGTVRAGEKVHRHKKWGCSRQISGWMLAQHTEFWDFFLTQQC